MGEHITISQNRVILNPRTFAKMLDTVAINSNELVLDVACGTGYSTAVIAHLAEAVVAVESNGAFADFAREALENESVDNAIVVNATFTDGAVKHGLYDVIIIQGAIQNFPESLVKQLKDGGRVVAIFASGAMGQCKIGIKKVKI